MGTSTTNTPLIHPVCPKISSDLVCQIISGDCDIINPPGKVLHIIQTPMEQAHSVIKTSSPGIFLQAEMLVTLLYGQLNLMNWSLNLRFQEPDWECEMDLAQIY